MLDRGDWIVPTFDFRLRPDKPALYYWLAMISYTCSAYGVCRPIAFRLVAVGTSLMTYHLGRRLFRPQAGLWGGLAMATNWMFAVAGRFATPDSTLIFCTTAALLAYVSACKKIPRGAKVDRAELVPRRLGWPYFVLMYVAMGLAVLAKGPVGVVLPGRAIGGFVLFGWLAPPAKCRLGSGQSRQPVAIFEANRCRGLRGLSSPPFLAAAWPCGRSRLVANRRGRVALVLLRRMRTHGVWWQEFFWNHNVERFFNRARGIMAAVVSAADALACFFPGPSLAGGRSGMPCGEFETRFERRGGLPVDALVGRGVDRVLLDMRHETTQLHPACVSRVCRLGGTMDCRLDRAVQLAATRLAAIACCLAERWRSPVSADCSHWLRANKIPDLAGLYLGRTVLVEAGSAAG